MKLVADTSAWIEFLRGTGSATDQLLIAAIDNHKVLLPDLVYHEVLRGMPTEAEARVMIKRFLRSKGIAVRGTVDLLVATWCINNDVPPLHADRDFAGFDEHLGLKR